MIIDIQVFEFSNTCTVRASMAVVRLTSMEALILSCRCTSIPAPSQPPASGRVLECLPATACGPTAPVSHRLNFTPYIASYIMGMAFSWRGCSLQIIPPVRRRSPLLRTWGYVILWENRGGSCCDITLIMTRRRQGCKVLVSDVLFSPQ